MGATGQDPTIMGHYHEVTWTGEAIQRFWEYFTLNQAAHAHHFSKIFGEAIVRVARKYAGLKGLVVDLGCGPGYLIPYLLNLGLSIKALDSSPHSVQLVQEHFGRHAGFQGAQVGDLCALPLCDEEADFIFLIEVLEHLKPEETPRALAEIFRILKPGGVCSLPSPIRKTWTARKSPARNVAAYFIGCSISRVSG